MLTFSEIEQIVSSCQWDNLIGLSEGVHLECKYQPYRLSDLPEKRELAKDVSAFANADGGFILVGFETRKSDTQSWDIIERIKPFPEMLFQIDQYRSVIRSWIFPEIKGLNINWLTLENQKGVGIIRIPPGCITDGPFVILKEVESHSRTREVLAGFARRQGDASVPTRPTEIADWLRKGLVFDREMSRRLDEILEIMRTLTLSSRNATPTASQSVNVPLSQEEVSYRLDTCYFSSELHNRPSYWLAAWDDESTELATVFQSGEGSIRHAFEEPPILRDNGWSLETFDKAKIVEGSFLQLTNGPRKILRLFRDGLFIMGASTGSDFLSLGNTPNILNQLALIELTYNFVSFTQLVIKDCQPPATQINFLVQLRSMYGEDRRQVGS